MKPAKIAGERDPYFRTALDADTFLKQTLKITVGISTQCLSLLRSQNLLTLITLPNPSPGLQN